MSEVKRFRLVDKNGYPAMPLDDRITGERWVAESDYDTTLYHLAALREELAEVKSQSAEYGRAFNAQCRKTDALQQRLAGAERRNSALSVLLREGLEESKEGDDWIDRVIAILSGEASDTRELEHDRAYRNGLMQGYNLAVNGSEKEYQDAVLRYSGAALNKPEEAKS